jgi:hypothetical protein
LRVALKFFLLHKMPAYSCNINDINFRVIRPDIITVS